MATSVLLGDFSTRLAEIDRYLEFIRIVDQARSYLVSGSGRRLRIEHETKKILKANFFVMYYNLVESTTRAVFTEIYEDACSIGINFTDLNSEWKRTIIRSLAQFNHDGDLNHSAYFDLTAKITSDIASGKNPRLGRLSLSGNVDDALISKLAEKHSIKFTPPPTSRAGTDLRVIKTNRNNLAHGVISFQELGRDYLIEDLLAIRRRSTSYLRCFLKASINYSSRKKYLA